MSNTFSPRTDGTVGKVAVRSQAHAAHLTIPLMLDAGIDTQDNNPTGPEHAEGGDSPAQAPALHTILWTVHPDILLAIRVDDHSQRMLLCNGSNVLPRYFASQELQLHRL